MWDLIVSIPDHCLSFYFLWTARGPGPGPPKRSGQNLIGLPFRRSEFWPESSPESFKVHQAL